MNEWTINALPYATILIVAAVNVIYALKPLSGAKASQQ